MYDMELDSNMRKAAGGFDVRLQADLLSSWDVELVSRTHLSAVVFEQKLRTATDVIAADGRILPAEVVVVPVLDLVAKQLRFYVVPVKEGMKMPKPKILRVRSPKDLNGDLIAEAAKLVAAEAHLAPSSVIVSAVVKDDQPLTCALLPAVCADNHRRAAESQSTMIRATLEQSLASITSRTVTLIDRSNLAHLLDEKKLSSLSEDWRPNMASELGRLVKADLLLVPCIHKLDAKTARTDLFAVEVVGGRIVACASWQGTAEAAPPQDKVALVLSQGIANHAFNHGFSVIEQKKSRHAEAAFLAGLIAEANKMRADLASLQFLSLRIADAIVGLSSDDHALMGELLDQFWWRTIPCLAYPQEVEYNPVERGMADLASKERFKKSGILALMQAQARQVLELPFTELATSGKPNDKDRLAQLYLRLDEPEKSMALLMQGGATLKDLAQNENHYGSLAGTLLNLGRYQDCADCVFSKEKLSNYAWLRGIAACRALGDKQREYKELWLWRNKEANSVDFIVRRLQLATEL
ncbi:MAG: hypothetical protein NTV80_01115, partial [Verrucomicrobia bacterium]|nr:hypothetical protein [Verrucomicrobiota bacterium]